MKFELRDLVYFSLCFLLFLALKDYMIHKNPLNAILFFLLIDLIAKAVYE